MATDDDDGPPTFIPPGRARPAGPELDRLRSIVDRAADRLADVDCHQLGVDLGSPAIRPGSPADRVVLALNAVLDARNILDEAEG